MRPQDIQRAEDNAQARSLREQREAVKKRIVLRVLEGGGSFREAANAASVDHRTAKRWSKENAK